MESKANSQNNLNSRVKDRDEVVKKSGSVYNLIVIDSSPDGLMSLESPVGNLIINTNSALSRPTSLSCVRMSHSPLKRRQLSFIRAQNITEELNQKNQKSPQAVQTSHNAGISKNGMSYFTANSCADGSGGI